MKAFFEKNKKVIIISAAVIVAGIITFIVIKNNKKNSIGAEANEVEANKAIPKTGVVFPIVRKLGSQTNADEKAVIKNIQKYLNSKITYVELPLTVDGIFGPNTEALSQRILGTKTISYSLYNELLTKMGLSPFALNLK